MPTRLALASLGMALAIGVVCAVGLSSIKNASTVARVAVSRQLALIDEAEAMRSFMYRKVYVAQYIMTGNHEWIAELDAARPMFESWLARARHNSVGPSWGHLLDQIQAEYSAFDDGRKRAVALYDAGHPDEAKAELAQRAAHAQNLRAMFDDLGTEARASAERTLAEEESALGRFANAFVATSVAGALASMLLGFMWARRITKPIYELQVQVQSAAERTRIQVAPGREGLQAIGDQVRALVERLEATDAALAEHRSNLIQSEKLSAVGELAAKLAHEVLNPLAGMKAAVQLLARQGAAMPGGAEVLSTAEALNREITRVEGLVRRLVNYARPLAPRFEVVSVGSLLDAAEEASQTILRRCGTGLERRLGADLPRVEVDPQLVTQALSNLIANAAQATAAAGRTDSVQLAADRAELHGRDQIVIRVSDHGPGLSDVHMRELFKPFFTTKPDGHGLGLAVSQNVVLEHGGRIAASNRPSAEGPGAVFEVQFPVAR